MNPMVIAIGTFFCTICIAVGGFTQEDQVPKMSRTVHASLAAYPHSVISLKDPITEMMFYVESNGLSLVAFDKDGGVVWSINVLDAVKLKSTQGHPVIRHLRLEGDELWVTYGKSGTVRVQIKTGKIKYVGAD